MLLGSRSHRTSKGKQSRKHNSGSTFYGALSNRTCLLSYLRPFIIAPLRLVWFTVSQNGMLTTLKTTRNPPKQGHKTCWKDHQTPTAFTRWHLRELLPPQYCAGWDTPAIHLNRHYRPLKVLTTRLQNCFMVLLHIGIRPIGGILYIFAPLCCSVWQTFHVFIDLTPQNPWKSQNDLKVINRSVWPFGTCGNVRLGGMVISSTVQAHARGRVKLTPKKKAPICFFFCLFFKD